MKKLLEGQIGEDGSYGLVIEDGKLKIELGYSIEAALLPLKSQVIDKLKAAIPGEVDDAILDKVWSALLEAVSEKE